MRLVDITNIEIFLLLLPPLTSYVSCTVVDACYLIGSLSSPL